MRYRRIFATLLLLFIQSLLLAQTITLARYPAISHDGETIAFSYQGDIWIKDLDGEFPRRLTIHEAYECDPVFSPDGDQIAFTSMRFGNQDAYVIDREGGAPTRLTYHSTDDQVTDWTADGHLLFKTRRAFAQVEWDEEIYRIADTGGTPGRYLDAVGEMAVQSPNGRYVAFVRGACRVTREAYQGPADTEIWLYDTLDESYIQVTDNATNDYLPRWNGDRELYFLSSINGHYNIVMIDVDNKAFNRNVITTYEDEGIRYFDVAGDVFVYERGAGIFLKKGEERPERIHLEIRADYRFDPVETKNYSGSIDEYALSPNGKFAAMVIRGEVFVQELEQERKRTVNISNHPYRDHSVAWLNDSALIFTSDRDGQYDLYLAHSTDANKPLLFNSLKRELVKITDTEENESNPLVSPDGEKISFIRGRGELVVADISADGRLSSERNLLDGWATPGGLNWSPDSRFLAYHLSDLNFNNDVYIQGVDTVTDPINVSMHPRGDYSPYWSEDGSKLGFLSSRNNGDMDVWFVWLRQEDWLLTREDREEGYYFPYPEPAEPDTVVTDTTTAPPVEEKEEAEEDGPMKIDLENIHNRLEQVTSLPGDEGNLLISPNGDVFYFTGSSNVARGSELYQARYDGSKIRELTSGGASPSSLKLSIKRRKIFFLRSGRIYSFSVGSQKITRYPHEAVMRLHREEEREQMFEEGWTALREGFYDPGFHGRDWDTLRAKYKPLALAASTTQDFRDMFNLMLGEINASHMGFYGPDPEDLQEEHTGLLGTEIEPAEEGVRITHVVPNTPADRPNSRLEKDERILSVDGETITGNTNFHRLLAHKAGLQVLLSVADENGRERETVIRPTRSIRTQLYEEWVNERQRLTEEYSDGRLGYVHIQGMNRPAFERFERDLAASGHNKEGIVIDVRYNGGGWTTDYLMAVLTVRQHSYTIPRGAADDLRDKHQEFSEYYPYSERLPLSAWVKPSVAMCNESSYSNAEIFAHAYKNLDLGTLVGMPTFGAVISTSSKRLIDGSYVRVPFRGWYVKATGENMENGPAVPDLVVDNEPDEKADGEDSQLEMAVEILLRDITVGNN